MDKITKEQRSKVMASIKSNGTKIELILSKALWAKGHRYRKNDKSILGTPDLTMKRHKLVIFCDGEFWHGKNWEKKQLRITENKEFWKAKIEKNMGRDIRVNQALREIGWTVLRFWENDIRKNLEQVVKQIEETINQIQKSR